MQTETILNGYVIIVVRRLTIPPEVYIGPPYKGAEHKYDKHGLKLWREQLERELQVVRLAEAMRDAAEAEGQA